jgi:hypothetical protein
MEMLLILSYQCHFHILMEIFQELPSLFCLLSQKEESIIGENLTKLYLRRLDSPFGKDYSYSGITVPMAPLWNKN